jgi:hypothetical protein
VRTLAALALLMPLVPLGACQHDAGDSDGAFYAWDDRRVHCAIDIDTHTRNELPSIETGLDRARDRGELLELFAHDPGHTVPWDKIEAVLAAARDRGLRFVTYADLAHGSVPPGPALALSFDDNHVADWVAGRDLYARYGARVTFFVAYYDTYHADDKAGLRALAADGHDIEAHSIDHLRGPDMVEEVGLHRYLTDEVQPSIDLLRADGYDVTTYAYPYGSRTTETDDAILARVPLLRSVTFTWSGVADPCPE